MATSEESKTGGTPAAFTGKVVVSGATGNIGQALLAAIATAHPDASVVALTRDPTTAKSKALATGNVTVAAAAGASFDGADAVIIVPPGAEDRAALSVAVAKAAAAAGVRKIISYSVPTGAATHMFARQFRELDAGVRAAAPAAVILKLPFFTDNNWGHAATIKGMGKIFAPVAVGVGYAQVTVGDAGAAGAAVLGSFDRLAGQTFTLVSNTASQADIAAAFGAALAKEVEAVEVPPAGAQEALLGMGMPAWQVEGVLELWAAVTSDDAGVNVRSRDLEALLGRKGTSIEEWVGAVKAGFA